MKSIALFAIAGYQRYISPHKGFCCAYRAYTGHRSCSALGYRAIQRYGVWNGLAVLRQRTERCAAALVRQAEAVASRRAQAGFCDIGCPCDVPSCDLPCDLPSFDCSHGATDSLDCCDACPGDCGDCGGWRKSKKRSEEDRNVHVPPPKKWSDRSTDRS